MKSRLVLTLATISIATFAQQWQIAEPGYQYEFPRDYFNHPDYQTEWWYYTGNLRAADGHRFGFELTFFREGIQFSAQQAASSDVTWRPDQIYLAHLALSDIDGGEFYHTERLNRAGPALAGARLDQRRCWNGNWQVRWRSLTTGEQELEAVSERLSLELNLKPEKQIIINGQQGVSRKGSLPGEASHYMSFTRLKATGHLEWKKTSFSLNGLAWMDHEFFSERRDSSLAGWDWFAIQLDNNEELMLYRLRSSSGQASPYSSGTYVDSQGQSRFLDASQFSLSPGGSWRSAASGANYPLSWKIAVPSLDLELNEQAALKNQELFSRTAISPSYWEGAVTYQGHIHLQPVHGVGYLEMTGYSKGLRLGTK